MKLDKELEKRIIWKHNKNMNEPGILYLNKRVNYTLMSNKLHFNMNNNQSISK